MTIPKICAKITLLSIFENFLQIQNIIYIFMALKPQPTNKDKNTGMWPQIDRSEGSSGYYDPSAAKNQVVQELPKSPEVVALLEKFEKLTLENQRTALKIMYKSIKKI